MNGIITESINEISNDEVDFVPLKNFESNYEIMSEYPFVIKNKKTGKILKEHISHGYVQVSLNGKPYYKHRLIGLQFLPNPDPINFGVIDHINHDRTDNHLENLRWCSLSDNNINRSSNNRVRYEFIDDIPANATIIDYYIMKNDDRREFDEKKYYYYY